MHFPRACNFQIFLRGHAPRPHGKVRNISTPAPLPIIKSLRVLPLLLAHCEYNNQSISIFCMHVFGLAACLVTERVMIRQSSYEFADSSEKKTGAKMTVIPIPMAKWLAHLPFTSKVAGSNLSENFLNQCDANPVLM